MADENRTFPTEINSHEFHLLDQILFHCKLGFANVVEYSPISVPETVPQTFSESR